MTNADSNLQPVTLQPVTLQADGSNDMFVLIMAPLSITLAPKTRTASRYTVEFDAVALERLAATCGWFHPDFLASVERAERDIRAGRVKRLRSFKDLRL